MREETKDICILLWFIFFTRISLTTEKNITSMVSVTAGYDVYTYEVKNQTVSRTILEPHPTTRLHAFSMSTLYRLSMSSTGSGAVHNTTLLASSGFMYTISSSRTSDNRTISPTPFLSINTLLLNTSAFVGENQSSFSKSSTISSSIMYKNLSGSLLNRTMPTSQFFTNSMTIASSSNVTVYEGQRLSTSSSYVRNKTSPISDITNTSSFTIGFNRPIKTTSSIRLSSSYLQNSSISSSREDTSVIKTLHTKQLYLTSSSVNVKGNLTSRSSDRVFEESATSFKTILTSQYSPSMMITSNISLYPRSYIRTTISFYSSSFTSSPALSLSSSTPYLSLPKMTATLEKSFSRIATTPYTTSLFSTSSIQPQSQSSRNMSAYVPSGPETNSTTHVLATARLKPSSSSNSSILPLATRVPQTQSLTKRLVTDDKSTIHQTVSSILSSQTYIHTQVNLSNLQISSTTTLTGDSSITKQSSGISSNTSMTDRSFLISKSYVHHTTSGEYKQSLFMDSYIYQAYSSTPIQKSSSSVLRMTVKGSKSYSTTLLVASQIISTLSTTSTLMVNASSGQPSTVSGQIVPSVSLASVKGAQTISTIIRTSLQSSFLYVRPSASLVNTSVRATEQLTGSSLDVRSYLSTTMINLTMQNNMSSTKDLLMSTKPSRSSTVSASSSIATVSPTLDKNLAFDLQFTITNRIFSANLTNSKSSEYKQLEKEVKGLLISAFGSKKGFAGVAIKGFRNGSVIVLSEAKFNTTANETSSTLQNSLETAFNKSSLSVTKLSVKEKCTSVSCSGRGTCITQSNGITCQKCQTGFRGTRCNEPYAVDGGYSSWSDYSSCTKECDGGTQYRTRTCNNPSPLHNGKNCTHLGSDKETRECNEKMCKGEMILAIIVSAACLVFIVVLVLAYCVRRKHIKKYYKEYGWRNKGCSYDLSMYAVQNARKPPAAGDIVPLEIIYSDPLGGISNPEYIHNESRDSQDEDIYRKQLVSFLNQTHKLRADKVNGTLTPRGVDNPGLQAEDSGISSSDGGAKSNASGTDDHKDHLL